MNKTEFQKQLRAALSSLTCRERARALAFYGEIIDDSVENGASEEEAVAALGDIGELAQRAVETAGRDGVKTKKPLWIILLLAIGSPLWVSLALAAAAVVVSLYAAVWAVVASLFAAALGLVLALPLGLLNCVLCFAATPAAALSVAGAGAFCAGIGIFVALGAFAAAKWLVSVTSRAASVISARFGAGRDKNI